MLQLLDDDSEIHVSIVNPKKREEGALGRPGWHNSPTKKSIGPIDSGAAQEGTFVAYENSEWQPTLVKPI